MVTAGAVADVPSRCTFAWLLSPARFLNLQQKHNYISIVSEVAGKLAVIYSQFAAVRALPLDRLGDRRPPVHAHMLTVHAEIVKLLLALAALQPQLRRMRAAVLGQQLGGQEFAGAHGARMAIAVALHVRPVRLQVAEPLGRAQLAGVDGRRRVVCVAVWRAETKREWSNRPEPLEMYAYR